MRSLCKIKLLSHESRPATDLQSFWTTVGIPCATLQYWNSNTCTNSPPAAGSDWNCPSACLESKTRTTVQEFVSGISSLGKHINDINNHHKQCLASEPAGREIGHSQEVAANQLIPCKFYIFLLSDLLPR